MSRTYALECNQKIGKKVQLWGWINTVRDHGKITFYDLRDLTGIVQTVSRNKHKITEEDVVSIKGIVKKRPDRLINPLLKTGKVEVEIESIQIISKANTLPFPIDTDGLEIDESLRLKYRYLDLRRERLKNNLRLRQQMLSFMRQFLTESGFIEIETPI